MATIDEAVKRLRIEASETGVSTVAAKTRDLAKAQDEVAESAKRQEQATQQLDRRYAETIKSQQAYAAANDNLMRSAQATRQSFIGAANETIQFAGHLKLAAAAAYIAIPAFRGLVNPAVIAGLQATGVAVAAISPAAVAAGSAIVTALTPALAFLSRIAIPALAIAGVYEFMKAVTELGERRRIELTELAADAEKAGVGVETFQRMRQAAKDVVSPIESATAAMKKFREVSAPFGSGSDAGIEGMYSTAKEPLLVAGGAFNKRLGELLAAGNFGNSGKKNNGVLGDQENETSSLLLAELGFRDFPKDAQMSGHQEFPDASTIEEQFRFAVLLIDDMLQKGERLAALDLAKTFLPPELVERLRSSNEALLELQGAADKVAQEKIFSAQDVAYAIDLTNRIKQAQGILADKWLPVQKDLTRLGLEYQETWVFVLRAMAAAVEKSQELYKWLSGGGSIVDGMAKLLTKFVGTSIFGQAAGPMIDALNAASKRPAPGESNIPEDARARLTAGLISPGEIQRQQRLATEIQTAVLGDKSKMPAAADDANKAANAYELLVARMKDRMEEMQIEIDLQDRDAEAVRRLKTQHELERAARKAGIEVGKEEIAQLAERYAAVERQLAQAKLIGDVRFERDQIGRTDQEAAIAQRLRGAGLNVDLNSNVAQMIRLNEQLKTAKDLSTEFALSFTRDIRNGVNALTALQNALNKVLDLLIEMAVKAAVAKSVGAASGFDFGSLFGAGKYGGGGAGDQGPTPAMVAHSGGIAGMGGGQRYVHPAYFENAPRYHMGVDEVPAILQRGETVLPRGSSARAPVINLNITNNAGADVQQGQARQNSDGSLDLDIFIERKVTKAIGGGAADSALRSRHGASPRVIAR